MGVDEGNLLDMAVERHILFLTLSVLGVNPKKLYTLHGSQKEDDKNRKSGSTPPPSPHAALTEAIL